VKIFVLPVPYHGSVSGGIVGQVKFNYGTGTHKCGILPVKCIGLCILMLGASVHYQYRYRVVPVPVLRDEVGPDLSFNIGSVVVPVLRDEVGPDLSFNTGSVVDITTTAQYVLIILIINERFV
jgi:hypothetical protein